MKFVWAIFIVAVMVGSGYVLIVNDRAAATSPTSEEIPAGTSPVLVELYTSEGCSSCPPADRLLTTLASTRQDVVTLSFHVDYWDHDGWIDRFSSPLYTRRQEIYAGKFGLDSTYTPQIVVNGTRQLVGSDAKKANEAILSAGQVRNADVALKIDSGRLNVDVNGLSSTEPATVFLAVTEDGLSDQVSAGENRGATLSHSSVVRQLTGLGVVEKRQAGYKTSVELPIDAAWKTKDLSYVVFVQENSSRKIDAVARIKQP